MSAVIGRAGANKEYTYQPEVKALLFMLKMEKNTHRTVLYEKISEEFEMRAERTDSTQRKH